MPLLWSGCRGLVKNRLHTICEEGRCPNRGECYAAGTATFLLEWFDLHPQLRVLPGGERTGSDGG